MTYKRYVGISVFLLVVIVLGIGLLIPKNSEDPLLLRSEKSKRMDAPYGYPDKFAEYFAAVEGLDVGYAPYPQGYQIIELQQAKALAAKRGVQNLLNWIERGPGNVGGRTRAILVDHRDTTFNTFFVGTVGGGVWKAKRSFDNGNEKLTWTPLTDHLSSLAVSAMAGASVNYPDVFYVGTGEGFFNIDASSGIGMFKTIDGGETWTHLIATINNPDWTFINRIAVDPDNPDIVIVATNTSIFRSEDGGNSFSKVFSYGVDNDTGTGRIQDLRAKPDDFNIQLASVNGIKIIRSDDAGKTWKNSLSSLRFNSGRIELAFSESHPNVAWASVDIFGDIPDLYRTEDAGESWKLIDDREGLPLARRNYLGGQGWYDNAIAVHPFSPDTVFLGGVWAFKSWMLKERNAFEIDGVFGTEGTFFKNLRFEDGTHKKKYIGVGPFIPGITDVDTADVTSIQIRFGPDKRQKAHRFSVDLSIKETGTKLEIPFSEHVYEDYVEVPFEVWDTDNNRQLMISFRDQANDGDWDLIRKKLDGNPPNEDSREWILISKYDYDQNTPHEKLKVDGGFINGLMYWIWPHHPEPGDWRPDDTLWNPSLSDELIISIVVLAEGGRNIGPWGSGGVHVDHHNFTIIPIDSTKNEFIVLNGNDGGLAYSYDSGDTWKEGDIFPGFNTAQFYDATKRPGRFQYIGGMQDNGTYISYNDANNRRGWLFALGGDGFDVIWKGADSLMGSIQFNAIGRSLNGGNDWGLAGNIQDFGGQFLTSIGWTPESGETVFSISKAGLLRSFDFGGSWHVIPAQNPNAWGRGSGGKVRVSLADPSVVWAGYRMRGNDVALHVSVNAQTESARLHSVTSPSFAPISSISGLATHPFERETAYVTFSVSCQPKLLRTEDMGQTWEDLSGFVNVDGCRSSNGFPNARVWDVLVFPDTPRIIWAGTDIGIFESRDHGQTWSYADNGLPAVSIWRMKIVDDEVIVATHGRGVWTLDIGQVQTSVEEAIAEVPTSFELLDNYPNPFNPSTTLGFKLSANSHIRITVYDVLGRKVAMLTDQPYTRGSHKITWDASAMSSGQYFYRMEANGELIGAKAMILAK